MSERCFDASAFVAKVCFADCMRPAGSRYLTCQRPELSLRTEPNWRFVIVLPLAVPATR